MAPPIFLFIKEKILSIKIYNIIHKGEKQYETKYENVYIRKTSRNNNKW